MVHNSHDLRGLVQTPTRGRLAVRRTGYALASGLLLTSFLLPPASAASSSSAEAHTPTTAEIAEAKGDAAAVATLVGGIESILADASSELQASQVEALQAQGSYNNALAVLEERKATLANAEARAAQAAEEHNAASEQVGQLAGDLYRSGGMTPGLETLLDSEGAADVMYKASTLQGLTAQRTRTLDHAETTESTWLALQKDADAARTASQEASDAAQAAEAQAVGARDGAAQLVAQKQAERSTLVGKLAALRNTTAELEEERVAALERAQRERDLARIIQESAAAAEAAQEAPAVLPAAPADQMAPAPVFVPPAAPAPVPPSPETAPPGSPEPEQESAPLPAPAPVPAPAPPSDSGAISQAINYAMSKTGDGYRYEWGGNGPIGYDCSGLTQQAFGSAGISLPRTASAQFYAVNHVPLTQLRNGDLVFWGEGSGIWHVAIYIGNNQVVNALNEDQGILVTNLADMAGMGAINPQAGRL